MQRAYLVLALVACKSAAQAASDAPPVQLPDAPRPPVDATPDGPPAPAPPLEITALGVQGFVLKHGDDVVMTAPLFTRQDEVSLTLNIPLSSDTVAVDTGLANVPLDKVAVIVSGHSHYDHLLDVPHVLSLAPSAVVATNLTGRNIFAALAPDRPAGCTGAAQDPNIARDRVIAMDDPLASHVDYTNCPDQAPPGAPLQGTPLQINPRIRLMAFCSMHPAQIFGVIHFAEGSIDTEQCVLPPPAASWLEGQTLAYLIDFLDDDGKVAFRVFYQDAPTNAPSGFVPPQYLADHRVDVGVMCVGSSDYVTNEPADNLNNVTPRFALGGHWEDFFQPISSDPPPIPFLDVDAYVVKALAVMTGEPDAPLLVDGMPTETRYVRVMPQQAIVVPPAPQ